MLYLHLMNSQCSAIKNSWFYLQSRLSTVVNLNPRLMSAVSFPIVFCWIVVWGLVQVYFHYGFCLSWSCSPQTENRMKLKEVLNKLNLQRIVHCQSELVNRGKFLQLWSLVLQITSYDLSSFCVPEKCPLFSELLFLIHMAMEPAFFFS